VTIAAIATAFSNGEFDKTSDFIGDDAVWEVVNEDIFKGKNSIIENCNRVAQYFQSVTTDFKILNIISEDNKVVVNGTAEFFRDGKQVSFVSACDIYEFNDKNQILKITSYCIQAK
jgi:ketosteroid isomerase-like protein